MLPSKLDPPSYWFLRNTACGMFLGFLLGICIAATLDSDVSRGVKEFYVFLVTSILTLIAAALTLVGVFATISQQREIERRSRLKKLEAARAFLPSALSQLCDIANHGIRYSFEFERFEASLGETDFREISVSNLRLTDEVISVFRDIIELSDDKNVTRRISGLLREHQVFLARWRQEFSPDRKAVIRGSWHKSQTTVAWAYLGAISASAFEYARSEVTTIETVVGEGEISSAINFAGVVDLRSEEHTEQIGLYARTFRRRFE